MDLRVSPLGEVGVRREVVRVLPVLIGVTLALMTAGAHAQTGSVQGTVRDVVTNEPLAQARVSIPGTQWSAVTDATGRYAIRGIVPGTYEIHVELLGYESAAEGNRRVAVVDEALRTAPPIPVDFWLRRVGGDAEGESQHRPAVADALTPGFGVAISVARSLAGGNDNQLIPPGTAAQLWGRYGLPNGLSLNAGVFLGTHHIAGVRDAYRLQSAFIEPQFAVRGLSPLFAPYLSVRVDFTREMVNALRTSFVATGYAIGGGGGLLVRVTPLVALDGGGTVGALTLGDFTVRYDDATALCLETLPEGTLLPDAVIQCGDVKGPVSGYTCPPQTDPTMPVECEKPSVVRANTGRSGTWFRFWVGVRLALVNIAR